MSDDQTLVNVEWEHPERGVGVRQQMRIMLREGQSARTIIANALREPRLADAMLIHRITPITGPNGEPCNCDGSF